MELLSPAANPGALFQAKIDDKSEEQCTQPQEPNYHNSREIHDIPLGIGERHQLARKDPRDNKKQRGSG